MSRNKILASILLAATLVIVLVFGVTGWLTAASYKNIYTNSLMNGLTVVGNEPVRKIEYALKYGKPLNNFYGIEKLLKEAKDDSPEIENIQVVNTSGEIYYDLNGRVLDKKLPPELAKLLNFGEGKDKVNNVSTLYDRKYHNFLPIYDRNSKLVGALDLDIDQSIINNPVNVYRQQTAKIAAALAVLAVFLLIVLIFRAKILDEAGQINRKRFLTVVLIVLGVVQLIFGYQNFQMFQKSYTGVARQSISRTAGIIQKDINFVLSKGVSYTELYSIQNWFEKILSTAPEIDRIYLSEATGGTLYLTGSGQTGGAVSKDDQYNLPLITKGQNPVAINVILSQKYIRSKVFDIAMDMLTVFITAIFLMVEVTILMVVFVDKQVTRTRIGGTAAARPTDVRVVRSLAFIFYYSAFMSISFIPTLMKSFYKPILGLPENVVLGLPISIELLSGGLAMVAAGYLIGSKGWKPIFFTGLGFFEIGAILSGLASGPIAFILARAVFGVGYGLCLIALQGFVNSANTAELQSEGMSSLSSGTYAGLNCACVIGAMLAERIGFSQVFFVTVGMAVVAGAFALFFMPNAQIGSTAVQASPETAALKVSGFFGNRQVFSFFLFIVIPVAVASMFLEFFVPVFAKGEGISSANVGRVFLLNGLAIVYLGPLLTKYISRALGIKRTTVLSALTAATALIVFALWGTFAAALSGAFLLGIASGFGEPSQNTYLLSLAATRKLGEGKALGFYSVMIKSGQVIGPLVFGLVMSIGILRGIGSMGLVLIGAMALFILFSRAKQKEQESDTTQKLAG